MTLTEALTEANKRLRDPYYRASVHKQMRKLGLKVPTLAEQSKNLGVSVQTLEEENRAVREAAAAKELKREQAQAKKAKAKASKQASANG